MRDRLIKLLTDNLPRCGILPRWDNPLQFSRDEQVEGIADHLLASGVIVPPCKVGDTVFMIKDEKIYDGTVRFLRWESREDRGIHSDMLANSTPYFSIGASFDDFGKTVFLTKAEAEQALKERENNANQ